MIFQQAVQNSQQLKKTSTNHYVKHCIHLHCANIMECVLCAQETCIVPEFECTHFKENKNRSPVFQPRSNNSKKRQPNLFPKVKCKNFLSYTQMPENISFCYFLSVLKYKPILNSSDSKNSKNTFSEFLRHMLYPVNN